SLSEFIELGEKGLLFEIWNLVFMQFDQQPDGSRPPLPAPSVDTGAGLERIAAVMQDVESNYDTDLFMPIIDRAEELIEKPYHEGPEGVGFRVLADHARAVAFLLADGVYPSNYGRGYVLRRILRRAVRHAYLLGREEPTLAPLAQVVVDNLGDVYPELREKASHIESVTRAEEERFLETIEGGLRRLEELTRGPAGTVSGEDAFKLYDTYGFPLDLTQVAAAERGWRVDEVGFERALSRQQLRSRAAGKRAAGGEIRNRETGQWAGRPATGGEAGKRGAGSVRSRGGKWVRVIPRKRQRWIGYETTRAETDILAFRKSSDRLELVLHENPFYAESGGQVSDTGVVKGEGWELPVEDVYVVDARKVVAGAFEGDFEPTPVEAAVAEARRRNIERNHTATHLVHAALRAVLGDHVRQAGSVVAPERLRFDFSHHAPMTEDELRSVEERVNEAIWLNPEVLHYQLPYGDAIARGAMALFGEKYGDRVRVVDVPGISLELCGGTHVRTTGQIGLFRFTGETGVAAGVRRIEAVTGPGAYEVVRWLDEHMSDAAGRLHTNPEFVARKIEGLIDEKRRLEKQVEELLRETGSVQREAFDEFRFGESTVLVGESPVTDRNQVGLLMDAFRARNRNAVQVLFVSRERPGIHVAVTDDLVRRGVEAGDLVNRIAAVSGGRGGGRPHFASAGAGDPAKLPEARRKTPDIVRDILGAGAN
ncbi:MAG: alanine--tRNA ligase, partial [Gemmatimonadales bacterium]